MSWLSKTKLIQDFVSVKRPIDFVPHGSVVVLDPTMTGTSRVCTQFSGEYTSLVSNTLQTTAQGINAGDSQITIDAWVHLPENALITIAGSEYVQVVSKTYTRVVADPTRKITVLGLRNPVKLSYASGVTLAVVGIPLQLLNTCNEGTLDFMFESTEISVSGDFIACFHYESEAPVLDAWQRIKVIQEKYEYTNSDGVVIRRYYCTLENPLQKTLDVDAFVYLKALPAYESPTFPVELSGSYHVDAFTGKTFGKGSDNLTLTLTLFDALKNAISTQTYSKNDVLLVSSFPACDFTTWRVGAGAVSVTGKFTSAFTLGSTGVFSVGDVVIKQRVSLTIALTFVATTTSTVYNAPYSYAVFVRTLSGVSKYLYNTSTSDLTVTSWDGTETTYSNIPATLYLDIDDTTDFLAIEIAGPVGVQVQCQNFDIKSNVTAYSQAASVSPHVPVRYLSYTYCANMSSSDTWEGSCLMLKPSFFKLEDLHTDVDSIVPDSGQVFQ